MTRVRFGDVVTRANTKEDRHNTDLKYYVGGEHIDTGELQVIKRGLIEGSTIGPMFYFGFKKGQVLLTSRSPDLKKAGIVTFDGICSEKTFVIETADENVLLQEYLPFIVRSEDFWSFANDNKSGSVNYFINWTTFAKYEFNLPSIEEQKHAVDLLWAAENEKQAVRKTIKAAENYKHSFVHSMLESTSDLVGVDHYCELSKEKYKGDYSDVNAVELDCLEPETGRLLKTYNKVSGGSGYTLYHADNVLFGKLRPYLRKYHFAQEDGICCNEILVLTAKGDTNPWFLYYLISSEDFIEYNNSQTFGTKMPRTSWKIAKEFQVPKFDRAKQDKFVEQIKIIDHNLDDLRELEDNLQKFIYRGINTVQEDGYVQ